MQQLLQTLKSGEMEIAELPSPKPGRGELLIRTHFSAISTGTEGKTVTDARKGYLAKAKSRKEEVAKVIKLARNQGLAATYKMVMNRLEALQPLGYSASGVVVEVGEAVRTFRPGDRVACGGASASHGELIAVSENLAVKLPEGTPLDEAAFTTLGAIAMQGLRRAELSLGESCAVIGLGLLGQITIRLLEASGIRAFGVDLKPELVQLAAHSGTPSALRSDDTIESQIDAFSKGFGVDAVIITAASASLDPVEFAGIIARQRGRVVIVGSVPTGFSRKAYYRKELDLRMSTSYGPGRYDVRYEEEGLDYPIGYVRWTENRNMQAFAELLGSGKLSLKDLISHRFPFEKAIEAFDLVVDTAADKMGVLLEYDTVKPMLVSPRTATQSPAKSGAVSFIGAGSFAGNFLLPALRKHIDFDAVATSRAHTAEHARRQFGFSHAYADSDQLLAASTAGAVVIATRHDTHAPLAIKALKAGKRVVLEKPLCIQLSEYFAVKAAVERAGSPDLMIGFNRRFAPFTQELKKRFTGVPVSINYRINAGKLPPDHWVHNPEIGGGRILGEVCHFIDFCAFLAGSKVLAVSAFGLDSSRQNQDTFAASLYFANGSVANISYFSNGNTAMGKEYIEVFGGGLSAVIDDFKSLEIFAKKRSKVSARQDKGHAAEMKLVAEAIKSGDPFPISTSDALDVTMATFALQASLEAGGARVEPLAYALQWISAPAN